MDGESVLDIKPDTIERSATKFPIYDLAIR